ncbi:hypothetical protein KM043_009995 [Ampulex compressa]|nr:hypothetical protein KM043_009995 [Ampulex compressa]
MMNIGDNHPSCIKIPPASGKQNLTSSIISPKSDAKDAMRINDELISLANRILGEENWSHTVTNQTLDFAESFMGKYVSGCATFVKIQLGNGIFHEDMGYCHAEGPTKGLAIYSARINSLTNAFKKVLMCFGGRIETEVRSLIKKMHNGTFHVQKDDVHSSLNIVQSELLLPPCAQSTPYACPKNAEIKEKEIIPRSKSPYDQNGAQSSTKLKLLGETTKQVIQQTNSPRPKSPNDLKVQVFPSPANIVQNKPDPSTDEELMRLERKRKQLEKQLEYKRLMKEKEGKTIQICDMHVA